MAENKYKYKKLKHDVDETSYEATAPKELFDELKKEVFKELSVGIKIQGFRPGKAPKEMIEKQLGGKLFTETVGRMLPRVAYEVIIAEKLNPITQLSYSVTNVGDEGDVTFTFSFTDYPQVKIGDYSKIKIEKKEASVDAKEIDSLIRNMITSRLPKEKWETSKPKASTKKTKADSESKEEKGKEHSHEHGKEPDFEITNELVVALGYDEAKTPEALRKIVKERLIEMKKKQNDEDYSSEVLKKLVEISDVPTPRPFLEKESKRLENLFTDRLKSINLDADVYLSTQGTSLEEKREEWSREAAERVKTELVLLQVASEEKVFPTDEAVEKEIDAIEDVSVRENYDTENGRDYIKSVLTKQNALKKIMEKVGKTSKE